MRLLFLLALVAATAFAAGRWMVTAANPEVAFWSGVIAKRDVELAGLRAKRPGEGVVLFTGGSSCAFSVDPPRVAEVIGRPCFNLGGVARAGANYLIHEALKRSQPGDLLVLALEPHFITEEGRSRPTQLGLAMSLEAGDSAGAAGGESFGRTVSWREQANLLRPGARYFGTWSAKLATGKLGYRYTMDDLRPGGRLETPVRTASLFSAALPARVLTEEGKDMLRRVAEVARRKNVAVVYSLPWAYTDPQFLEQNRAMNRNLMQEVATLMPVLDDPAFGTCAEKGFYADSEYHLTAEGSHARSLAVAAGLKANLGGRSGSGD